MPLRPPRTCEMLQVSSHVSAAEAWTSGVHVVRASWRREVPPSRRLTARERTSRGPYQVSPRLVRGQPDAFRRWHPCCCRCLLKGCKHWFVPPRPQARYCSPACREAAEHWRSWHAGQIYRATNGGKERRREQAQRRRERERQRAAPAEPAASIPAVESALPVIEAQSMSDSAPMIPEDCHSVGQRQTKFDQNFAVHPVVGLLRRSSCPHPVLPINISVPAHAARPYGEFTSAKPDSDSDAGEAPWSHLCVLVDHPRPHRSCRRVLTGHP